MGIYSEFFGLNVEKHCNYVVIFITDIVIRLFDSANNLMQRISRILNEMSA